MFEVLRSRNIAVIPAAITLALGVSACGSSGAPSTSSKVEVKAPILPKKVLPNLPGITYQTKYFDDGTRLIKFSGQEVHSPDYGYTPNDIYEFCDGRDLVEETLTYVGGNGELPESLSRSVNHPACADGKLTPSDFTIHHTVNK